MQLEEVRRHDVIAGRLLRSVLLELRKIAHADEGTSEDDP